MLLSAYEQGIFPWYTEDDPIIWQSQNPRFVIFPQNLHISSSMKKILKKKTFEITFLNISKEMQYPLSLKELREGKTARRHRAVLSVLPKLSTGSTQSQSFNGGGYNQSLKELKEGKTARRHRAVLSVLQQPSTGSWTKNLE